MKIKIVGLLFLLLAGHLSIAGDSVSSDASAQAVKNAISNNNSSAAQSMPVITNEAEYAEWVRKREGASQAGSVKSKQQTTSKISTSMSSSSARVLVK